MPPVAQHQLALARNKNNGILPPPPPGHTPKCACYPIRVFQQSSQTVCSHEGRPRPRCIPLVCNCANHLQASPVHPRAPAVGIAMAHQSSAQDLAVSCPDRRPAPHAFQLADTTAGASLACQLGHPPTCSSIDLPRIGVQRKWNAGQSLSLSSTSRKRGGDSAFRPSPVWRPLQAKDFEITRNPWPLPAEAPTAARQAPRPPRPPIIKTSCSMAWKVIRSLLEDSPIGPTRPSSTHPAPVPRQEKRDGEPSCTTQKTMWRRLRQLHTIIRPDSLGEAAPPPQGRLRNPPARWRQRMAPKGVNNSGSITFVNKTNCSYPDTEASVKPKCLAHTSVGKEN